MIAITEVEWNGQEWNDKNDKNAEEKWRKKGVMG